MSTSSSIGSIQGSPWDGWIGIITFCPFTFNFILSLSKDIKAFIFLPQGQPTNVGKELDPSSGSIISKPTLVDIPFIVVSMFLHTPIGSIMPWMANFRYIPDSYS